MSELFEARGCVPVIGTLRIGNWRVRTVAWLRLLHTFYWRAAPLPPTPFYLWSQLSGQGVLALKCCSLACYHFQQVVQFRKFRFCYHFMFLLFGYGILGFGYGILGFGYGILVFGYEILVFGYEILVWYEIHVSGAIFYYLRNEFLFFIFQGTKFHVLGTNFIF